MADPSIAFVVDALPGLGGSERVLMAALERFPDAAVHTLIHNPAGLSMTTLAGRKVFTSWAARLPGASQHYRSYLPLLPFAIRGMDLRAYNLVVSFHYAVAHGIRSLPGQTHLSYVYTPLRYAWRNDRRYLPRFFALRWPMDLVLGAIRKWDRQVAASVTNYAAVSEFAAGNVRRAFRREATVIYPPVEVKRFRPGAERQSFYLAVTRLVAHKNVDLLVGAFSQLGLPLLIVGDGPLRAQLQRAAAPNVRFLGFQTDAQVEDLMGRARGFVHAAEEDFGIALLEAQASGCPAIAFAGGAVPETLVDGLHGILFYDQTAEAIREAVLQFDVLAAKFEAGALVANARRFDKPRFLEQFGEWVARFAAGGSPPAPGRPH